MNGDLDTYSLDEVLAEMRNSRSYRFWLTWYRFRRKLLRG